MKRRLIPWFPPLAILLFGMLLAARPVDNEWQPIVPGVSYREFELTGPVLAYVVVMDRDAPNVTIDSAIARGTLSGGRETVSAMAKRYDQAINPWGGAWGGRNRVVVAINGSFFDLETGIPQTGMIQSGMYVKLFEDNGGGSGFAWKENGTAFVGECITHKQEEQTIIFFDTGRRMDIHGLNRERRGQDLFLYTSQFDRQTLTDDQGVEVLVELREPAFIPPRRGWVVGYVREIRDRLGSTPIPFDHIVLSAQGRGRDRLLENARLGGMVGISLRPTHLDEDCRQRRTPDWMNVYASLGGSFYFLAEDEIREYEHDLGATGRHPRTAICLNESDIFFVVVDGRTATSVGMTIRELGEFCRDTLGARWGVNQDGGGSSTMWVSGEVMNQPSDGSERPVANGYMIVVVEPVERSTIFAPGDTVVATRATNVWLGPGTNYAPITSVPEGETGTILSSLSGVEGVLAKGSFWWKVGFARSSGWVVEEDLALVRAAERRLNQGSPSEWLDATSPLRWILKIFRSEEHP